MSTFKQFEQKRPLSSTPITPTSSFLSPSRPFAPVPTSQQVPLIAQKKLDQSAHLGHSLARISLFPPTSDDDRLLRAGQLTAPDLQTSPNEPANDNKIDMPDTLKAAIEGLSGMPMDDVQVHYNSPKPSQVQALAYTRGTEIHVRSGQERHLAHEAWHVVQQKQGRVKPTNVLNNQALNSDPALETEADRMGAKILQNKFNLESRRIPQQKQGQAVPIIQRTIGEVKDSGNSPHVIWSNAFDNFLETNEKLEDNHIPVVIEVMERDVESAKRKIDQIAHSREGTIDSRAIMVGYNQPARNKDYDNTSGIMSKKAKISQDLIGKSVEIATHMEKQDIIGGSFPMLWSPTNPTVRGYTFPFLEARARVTLHNGTRELVNFLSTKTDKVPLMRSMDSDVKNDPLLNKPLIEGTRKELAQIGLSEGPHVVSGGYEWDTSPQDEKFWLDSSLKEKLPKGQLDLWNGKLTKSLKLINYIEHLVRENLNEIDSRLVYWPEPNSYMISYHRQQGAEKALEGGVTAGVTAQQREMAYYVKGIKGLKGVYNREMTTTKPLKDYFKGLRDMIKSSDKSTQDPGKIISMIKEIRQSHLNFERVTQDIRRWHDWKDELNPEMVDEIKRTIDAGTKQLSQRLQTILSPEEVLLQKVEK